MRLHGPIEVPKTREYVGKGHKNRRPRRGPRPGWLHQVDEILERVEATVQQYFDRHDVEFLFGLRKDAACKLMRQVGNAEGLGAILGAGTRSQAHVVARRDLLLFLHRTKRSPEQFAEHMRKQKLTEQLAEAGRVIQSRKIRIQPIADVSQIADLPAGIKLGAGRLEIEFFGTEDLLKHLYALAEAVMGDFPRFQAICEGIDR
jgi:hypothetical protein